MRTRLIRQILLWLAPLVVGFIMKKIEGKLNKKTPAKPSDKVAL